MTSSKKNSDRLSEFFFLGSKEKGSILLTLLRRLLLRSLLRDLLLRYLLLRYLLLSSLLFRCHEYHLAFFVSSRRRVEIEGRLLVS